MDTVIHINANHDLGDQDLVAILDLGKKGKKHFFQLNFALAQPTDKRDPMYYTSK
jgi:hypothetical protein